MANDLTSDISDLSRSFGSVVTGLAAAKAMCSRRSAAGIEPTFTNKELVEAIIQIIEAVEDLATETMQTFGKVTATFERFDLALANLAEGDKGKRRYGRKR